MKENLTIKELQNKCIDLKKHVIDMIWKAQSGHPGGSLSIADFMTACYFRYMNVDPDNPRWEDRDRFVLSKGHVCPAQYAALAMKGYFSLEVLDTLRKEGSPLQGHPSMTKCPGIDISTGSLGQGLACAVGMALAAKLDGKNYRVFSAVGDGECNEGEINLGSLRNRAQIQTGQPGRVCRLEQSAAGWHLRGDYASHRSGQKV